MLEVTQKTEAGYLHLVLRGEITSLSAPQLEQTLLGRLAVDPTVRWLLDLGGLTFTSSAGLRVFLAYAKKAKASGGRLVFCSVQPDVFNVLEVSGFTQILTIVRDPEAARPLFTSA